jgi:predicted Fe-S protein YdhL (DUF1289 family)
MMDDEFDAKAQVGESTLASPCIRICCLDEDNMCLGCFRTLDEIKAWTATDNPGRALVLQHCAQRREAHDRRFPGLTPRNL